MTIASWKLKASHDISFDIKSRKRIQINADCRTYFPHKKCHTWNALILSTLHHNYMKTPQVSTSAN